MLPAQLILYKGNISLVYCSAQLCTTQLFPASLFTVSVVLSVPNSFVVCLTHTVYVNTLTSPSLVSPFLYFVLLVFPRPCLLSPAGHDAFLILSAWVIPLVEDLTLWLTLCLANSVCVVHWRLCSSFLFAIVIIVKIFHDDPAHPPTSGHPFTSILSCTDVELANMGTCGN